MAPLEIACFIGSQRPRKCLTIAGGGNGFGILVFYDITVQFSELEISNFTKRSRSKLEFKKLTDRESFDLI